MLILFVIIERRREWLFAIWSTYLDVNILETTRNYCFFNQTWTFHIKLVNN